MKSSRKAKSAPPLPGGFKIATWNINSLRIRMELVQRWLAAATPDVVCLQETKLTDDQFPADELRAMGYPHLAWVGERTYNGVAMLSRFPLEDVRLGFAEARPDDQPRLISATVNGIRIYGCYVVNGQEVGSPKFAVKLEWLDRLRAEVASHHAPTDNVVVCGDMNVALDDADVWDPFECEGHLLYHPLEREKMQQLLGWGLTDTFRKRYPFASQFSWWDYRSMGFVRNHGLRIDHVFATKPLVDRLIDVQIWREVRGWEQPSDHAPVVLHLQP